MFTGVILTRGALEVAEEVRPYLELDDEPEPGHANATREQDCFRLEFAVLLEEAALACGGRA
jgi:hypothetical protein